MAAKQAAQTPEQPAKQADTIEAKPSPAGVRANAGDPQAVWAAVLEAAESRVMQSVVKGCELVELAGDRAVLRASATIGRLASDRSGELESLLARVLGRSCTVEFASEPTSSSDVVADEHDEPAAPSEHNDPLVAEAARLFNARVAGVHPKARPGPAPGQ